VDPTNRELYELVLKDAPFVIAAYGVLWVSLVAFVAMVLRRIMRLEKEIEVVQDSINRRSQ
jgi:CcmD family protein